MRSAQRWDDMHTEHRKLKVLGLPGPYQPQTLCVGWYVPVEDFRA